MTKKDVCIELKSLYDRLIFLDELKCAAANCKCTKVDEWLTDNKDTLVAGAEEIFNMPVCIIDTELIATMLQTGVFEKYVKAQELMVNFAIDKLNKKFKSYQMLMNLLK